MGIKYGAEFAFEGRLPKIDTVCLIHYGNNLFTEVYRIKEVTFGRYFLEV